MEHDGKVIFEKEASIKMIRGIAWLVPPRSENWSTRGILRVFRMFFTVVREYTQRVAYWDRGRREW